MCYPHMSRKLCSSPPENPARKRNARCDPLHCLQQNAASPQNASQHACAALACPVGHVQRHPRTSARCDPLRRCSKPIMHVAHTTTHCTKVLCRSCMYDTYVDRSAEEGVSRRRQQPHNAAKRSITQHNARGAPHHATDPQR